MLAVLVIAVIAGIAVALQGQAMGAMNRSVGTPSTILATYGSGALIALLIWFFRRSQTSTEPIPWYSWTAGVLGLLIIGGIGYAAPRIGLTRTLIITVAAQLVTAMLLEHFGIWGATVRGIDAQKLAGVALTIVGVWLVVR